MPLAQRLPKLGGFKNPFKKVYAVVNLSKLNRFPEGATVDAAALISEGLARPGEPIKVLAAGGLRRRLTVQADAISEGARAAIEARGGSVQLVGAAAPTEPAAAKPAAAKPAAAKPAAAAAQAEAAANPEQDPDDTSEPESSEGA